MDHSWMTSSKFRLFLARTCCLFRPAFGKYPHLKAGRNKFFHPFSTFFLNFKSFSMNLRLKSRETFEKTVCFSWFPLKNHWKRLKLRKKVENGWKKYFDQHSGVRSTWAGLNTQHTLPTLSRSNAFCPIYLCYKITKCLSLLEIGTWRLRPLSHHLLVLQNN